MTFAQFAYHLIGVINVIVIPLIFALAFVIFLWGIVDYSFLSVGDTAKQTKARSFMLYGLLGMVVLFSVWGLVSILINTFNL